MGIGTSIGLHFKDEMEMWQHALQGKSDKSMENTPADVMGNNAIAKDPNNITDDSGDIVDYSTPDQLDPLLEQNRPVITP